MPETSETHHINNIATTPHDPQARLSTPKTGFGRLMKEPRDVGITKITVANFSFLEFFSFFEMLESLR